VADWCLVDDVETVRRRVTGAYGAMPVPEVNEVYWLASTKLVALAQRR
jgi:hypothetical protein